MNPSNEAWQEFRAIPLFRELASDVITSITSLMEDHSFSRDEYILRQGTVGRSVSLLTELRCDVVKENTSKGIVRSLKLTELVPFETFGEMTLFNGQPHTASVLARTKAKVLRLGHEHFESIAKDDPTAGVQLASNMVSIVSQRLQHMDEWLTNVLHVDEETELDQWSKIQERLQHSPGHLL